MAENKKKINWIEFVKNFPFKTNKQCYSRFSRINPKTNKGKWSLEEDKKILSLHQELGNKWALISKKLNRMRSPKQIRDRFNNILNPELNLNPFSKEEDEIIVYLVNKFGNKWSLISSILINRSCNKVKNRYKCFLEFNKQNYLNVETDKILDKIFSDKINDFTSDEVIYNNCINKKELYKLFSNVKN